MYFLMAMLLIGFVVYLEVKSERKHKNTSDVFGMKQKNLISELQNDDNYKIDKNIEIKKITNVTLNGRLKKNMDPASYLLIDDTNKLFWILAAGEDKIRKFNYSDLIEFEVKQNGVSIVSGSVGSAIVGGLAFGTTGAIIGSSSSNTISQKINDLSLIIRVSNFTDPSVRIILVDTPIFERDVKYKELMSNLETVISYLTFIKNYNEKN